MSAVGDHLARNADRYLFDQGHAWLNDLMPMLGRASVPCRRCGLDYAENYDLDAECPGVRPTCRNGDFAVYPLKGEFYVMRYGGGGGEPFHTTDVGLAAEVCAHWAAKIAI